MLPLLSNEMESYSFSSLLGLKDVCYWNLLTDVIKRFSLHSYIHNFLIKFIHLKSKYSCYEGRDYTNDMFTSLIDSGVRIFSLENKIISSRDFDLKFMSSQSSLVL